MAGAGREDGEDNYTLFETPASNSVRESVAPYREPSQAPGTVAEGGTEELLTFLALASVRGMGRGSLSALYDLLTPLDSFWETGPEVVRDVLRQAKNSQADAVMQRISSDRTVLRSRGRDLARQLQMQDISVLFDRDPRYPRSLFDLPDRPRWIFVQGSVDLLKRRSAAAVVGTREPTPAGRLAARQAGRVLADAGFSVVSGLAEGIDQEVHQAVLEVGGEAVAVLGHGIGVEFPAGSSTIRRSILESGGAVVSEYLPNESYSRRSFIERNRIQAALSSVVIPVQGTRKSGTAHTVRFALELRRPLVGVWSSRPGPMKDNEMLDWLVELGATIYDLSKASGIEGLLEELKPYAADARPLHDQSEARRRAYAAALKALSNALRERPPSAADAQWMTEQLDRLIRALRASVAHPQKANDE